MSTHCQIPSIPPATARSYADTAPRADFYGTVGDELESLIRDLHFPTPGSLAHHPDHVLPLVTVFQFIEGLTDAQAVLAVRSRVDWKYALHLHADDAGFDLRALSEFRRSVSSDTAASRDLERLVERIVGLTFHHREAASVLSSERLLAAVDALDRLTLVIRTLAVAADGAAMAAPDWSRRHVPVDLPCDCDDLDQFHLPADPGARERLARTVGDHGYRLLDAVSSDDAPPEVRDLPEMILLSHVWRWQFARSGRGTRWLETAADASGRLARRPVDPVRLLDAV